MVSINEDFEIGPIMKLVDLNKDVINFDLQFKVSAENGEEFDLVVVDQGMLDSGSLEYQRVKGEISGTIQRHENAYQNFMMVMKAEKPLKVHVQTEFDRLPDHIPTPEEMQPLQPLNEEEMPGGGKGHWKMIMIIIVIIVGCGLIYYFYVNGEKGALTDGECPDGGFAGALGDAFDTLRSIEIS